MRILYVTQFYPPEPGAASVRAKEFAENWAADGHQVTVLSGFPSYLEGRVYDGYRNRLLQREERRGVRIARVLTLAARQQALVRRASAQIVFLLAALAAGVRLGRFDAVVASSPPFVVGLIGWVLARLVGARFVFDVRDLYPESAIELGVIRNRALIWVLRRIERMMYRGADLTVAVTEGIERYVVGTGIAPARVARVTNGVNTEQFQYRAAGRAIRGEWGLEEKFIVQYAGLIGMAQGLDTILDTAELLRDRREIVFVLIGEGIEKERLVERAAVMGLKNVRFIAGQSLDRVPDLMSAADVGLALKKKVPLNQGAIPVKMFEYMACSRPVIVGGAAEAEAILRAADAGLCIDPTEPKQVAQAVLDLYKDPERAARLGQNGRAFVARHFSRKRLSDRFLASLRDLTGNGDAAPRANGRP